MMKAYLLHAADTKLYLCFGENAVSAGEVLAKKLNISIDEFSVSGSWVVDPEKPIVISDFWPYFTCSPPEKFVKD
mgnify:CR=1 FL=1